ncbi:MULTISPECIES: hypothetical protein [Hyphomonas]|jgi:hypothetical protein|uniref:hypothetical protein n=1 Tax=Hyphomonas TaxID=85 RepID=UPI0035189FEE
MPQPLPRKYAAQVVIDQAAAQRQQQALNAANAISQWSKFDAMMPVLYNSFLPSDPTHAAVTFAAIRNAKTRQDTIRKLGEISLKDQNDRYALDAILKIYESTARGRDKIAHHLWGVHKDIPDAIILVDPRVIRDMSTATKAHATNADFTIEVAEEYLEKMRKAMMVWRTDDFADITARSRRGFILTNTFSIMCTKVGPHAPDLSARKLLYSQPEISEHLASKVATRK